MTQEQLEKESGAIASEHGLELERVRSVLEALDDDDKCFWVRHGPGEELRNAIGYAGPTQAIETFEGTKLEVLGVYVIWTMYLTSRLTPLYTLGELADLIEAFISYLKRNRSHLLNTGYLQTRFDRSPWLEWHLGRLYYVKRPIVSELERPSPAKPQRDEFGDLFYKYFWAREQPRRPFVGGRFQDAFDLNGHSIVTPEGAPVTFCDYEQAPMMPGLMTRDEVELARLRPKLLELRLRILRRLLSALRRKDAGGLWEDCVKILTQTSRHGLTADEAELLVERDLYYGPTDETMPSPDYAPHPLEHNGGLNSLLTVIWHVEKEIEIGTMRTVRDLTEPWLDAMQLQSYYQAIRQAWRADLEEAVTTLFWKSAEEDGFWEKHRQRLEKALDRDFDVEIDIRTRMPAELAESARAQLEAFVGMLEAQVKAHSTLPQLTTVYTTLAQDEGTRARPRRIQDVVPFPVPEGTTWDQVVIEFWNDRGVRITVGNIVDHKTYEDMGFVDRRQTARPPDKVWLCLRELAKRDGQLTWKDAEDELPPTHTKDKSGSPSLKRARLEPNQIRALAKWKKYVSDINKRLKNYFPGIEGRAFYGYSSTKGYRTKFVLRWTDSYRRSQ